MATKKLSIKLLVDNEAKKVLFAEANSDFVDFLFNLLSLPIATVIKILTKTQMSGCLANLYESVENLNEDYVQPDQNKDSLLKAKSTFTGAKFPLLMPAEGAQSTAISYYVCSYCRDRVSNQYGVPCSGCSRSITSAATFVNAVPSQVAATAGSTSTGFVKGLISYMVTDDLVVTPMSTVSSITLLNKFNVDSVKSLEEKVINLGMAEGIELLKASLQSETVLTDVFLRKKNNNKEVHVPVIDFSTSM